MKNALLSIAVLAAAVFLASNPSFAQEADTAQPAAPFQVIRLGDNQLSCDALITQINDLNTEVMGLQTAMTDRTNEITQSAMNMSRGQSQTSTLMSLGSLAASFIPGASLAVGAAQQVASVAQQAQMQAQQNEMYDSMESMTADMSTSMNAMMPLSQRIEHLTEISRNKGC